MKTWMAIGVIFAASGIAGATPDNTSKATTKLEVPDDAKLVGTSEVAEVHAFPELNESKSVQKNKNKSKNANPNQNVVQAEDVVGFGAVDRVYETSKRYKDAVGYYDSMIKSGSMTQLARRTTGTATTWELKLSDGNTQEVIVRNTRPTTIETVQAAVSADREKLSAQKNK